MKNMLKLMKAAFCNRAASILALTVAMLFATGAAAHADTASPVDLSTTATSIVTWVTAAIAAGLGIFAVVYGAGIIIKGFKRVGK